MAAEGFSNSAEYPRWLNLPGGHQLSDSAGHLVPPAIIWIMLEETHRDEPFQALHKLIPAWCHRRCLEALNFPAYLAFNGLTGAWRCLYDALNNLRVSAGYELTDEEAEKVDILIDLARRIA